jgi:hypothetical protein
VLLGAKQPPQGWYVQPRVGPVDQRVEHAVHLAADLEQQVAAVLDLGDRILIAEAAAGLLGGVQAKAQTGAVDPPIADLAQAPYRRVLRQGGCDLRQGLRVGHCGKAVALLREADPGRLRLAGDPRLTVRGCRSPRWRSA